MDVALAAALLAATLRMSTPLLYAAMGGLLSERSGIMNIALEGFMLIGAFGAAMATYYLQNPYLGVLAGALLGGLTALIHGLWCITLRGDQIVAGTAINLLGVGLPNFLLQKVWGVAGRSPLVPKLPALAAGLNLLVWAALLLPPLIYYLLYHTRAGLRIVAVGEHPRAAETVGVPVDRYRWGCVLASGLLAGVGGAQLSIGDLSMFITAMTAGRGFIALAAMIFGNWKPIPTLLAVIFFGAVQAVQLHAQVLHLPIPQDLVLALPYIITLLAVAGVVRRSLPPAGLGKHAGTE